MIKVKRISPIVGMGIWLVTAATASGETGGTTQTAATAAQSTTATVSETSAPAKIYYTNGAGCPVVLLTINPGLKLPSFEILKKDLPSKIVVFALWENGKLLMNTTPLRDLTDMQYDYLYQEFQLPPETVTAVIAEAVKSNQLIRKAQPPRIPDAIELNIDVKSTTSGEILDSSEFPFHYLTSTTENGNEPYIRHAILNIMKSTKTHEAVVMGQHRGYWTIEPSIK